MNVTRREAIIKLAIAMGATAVGPRLLGASLDAAAAGSGVFQPGDIALLDEIGDTIIPATDVPGAKAVGIGAFMALMVQDCYTLRGQRGSAPYRRGEHAWFS